MGIFGFKISPQMALVMMLAGLGIMFYGFIVILIEYADLIVLENWLDWYHAAYWSLHFFAIGMGAYLTIASISNRKGK